MKSKVCVIIPVYNEGQVIAEVVNEVLKYYSNVVCVNDGSKDNSPVEIEKTKATLLNHPINMGAGAATQTGIEYALQDDSIEYFVTFDGDGQHRVEDIEPLLNYLIKEDLDVALGSRFLGKVENISKLKSVLLKAAKIFNLMTTKVELSDPHIGLRVFNRKFAKSLDITLHGFAHASEIVEHIGTGKFKYGEYPVTVIYTDYSLRKGQPMVNAINIVFDLVINRLIKK